MFIPASVILSSCLLSLLLALIVVQCSLFYLLRSSRKLRHLSVSRLLRRLQIWGRYWILWKRGTCINAKNFGFTWDRNNWTWTWIWRVKVGSWVNQKDSKLYQSLHYIPEIKMPNIHLDRICELCNCVIVDSVIIACHECQEIQHFGCIEEGYYGSFDWIWRFCHNTQRFPSTLLYVCRNCCAARIRMENQPSLPN